MSVSGHCGWGCCLSCSDSWLFLALTNDFNPLVQISHFGLECDTGDFRGCFWAKIKKPPFQQSLMVGCLLLVVGIVQCLKISTFRYCSLINSVVHDDRSSCKFANLVADAFVDKITTPPLLRLIFAIKSLEL